MVLASMLMGMATAGLALPPMPPRIDRVVRSEMARGVKGLALAVVEDGRVTSTRSYGVRNAANAPLTPTTIMYGASLTKAVFAYATMRLMDEGKVDLDRPIADMLPQPLPAYGNLDAYGNWGDLAGDPRWRTIAPRMVLTHSTGFANFSFLEPDGKLRIHFDPGTRYSYSGEGLMLLQFALERGLGVEMEAKLERLVFAPLAMGDTSLVWRPDFAGRVADGWTIDGKPRPHDERGRVRVAGSMDTTIDDLARFAAALVSGEGLSGAARAEMVRPQRAITTASQFPTLQPDAPPAQRIAGLSAGLGVVTFTGLQGPGFYKGGHDDITANMMVCLERGRRCVVILANDVRAEAGFPAIVRAVLGEAGVPWRWEYAAQPAR